MNGKPNVERKDRLTEILAVFPATQSEAANTIPL